MYGGKTEFRVLLQRGESEGSVHLPRSGSKGASEGTSKTNMMFNRLCLAVFSVFYT